MKEVSKKYKEFLIKALGKSPTKTEMSKISGRMDELNLKSKKGELKIDIKTLYDKELSRYWKKIVAYENNGEEIELLTKYISIKDNANILSLASGIGVFEMFIAREFLKKGKINCLDFSKEMNKIAKSIKNKLKIENIKIITASATKIPIKSNSQDIILARRTGLSSKKVWPKVLKEVLRIMKKDSDSRFIYTVQGDFNKSLAEIKNYLNNAKLIFIKMDSFRDRDNEKIDMIIARKR